MHVLMQFFYLCISINGACFIDVFIGVVLLSFQLFFRCSSFTCVVYLSVYFLLVYFFYRCISFIGEGLLLVFYCSSSFIDLNLYWCSYFIGVGCTSSSLFGVAHCSLIGVVLLSVMFFYGCCSFIGVLVVKFFCVVLIFVSFFYFKRLLFYLP